MPEVQLLDSADARRTDLPRVGSRIDGSIVIDDQAPVSEVFDPATGHITKLVAHADSATVDRAVAVAAEAARVWRDVAMNRRFAILMRLRELIVQERDAFVDLIVSEGGKARPDAQGELNRTLDGLDSVFSAPVSLQGAYGEQVARGIDSYSLPHPLGVVATITPFNFPVMIPLWDAAAALVCGNAVIHKPSPRVPSAALLLAELIEQAGVPEGVYNVVQGEADTVNALLDHEGIAAASFVGSTPVAKHVYTRGCAAGKRVQALGGAKNHIVVMPDCDLDFTADSLVSGAFGSTGQRCMAATLAVAVGDVADPLRAAIAQRIPSLRVGPGTDPESERRSAIVQGSLAHRSGTLSMGVLGGTKNID